MLLESGLHPGALKDRVCSPGGTTIDAVYSLEKNGFRGALMEAVYKAAEKSRRM
jgi:pyrroline-5-carboxylate reductase